MSRLDVDSLTVGYGETPVLQDVSLTVEAGSILAVVGRNGVGKTTTLRTIIGSLHPWSGTIHYDGEDITRLEPTDTVRRGIGIVPEDRRMFPDLTVEESLRLSEFGGSRSAHHRSVEEIFETFDHLDDRRESVCRNLSGGEQQMLAIARALVAGADLLLLDEPTEGLAPMVVDRVADLVTEVNAAGISILLVEQNVAVALELADAVTVLDGGEVVFDGLPDDLHDNDTMLDRHLGVTMTE